MAEEEKEEVPGFRFHTLADEVDLQSMLPTAELRMLRFELAIRCKPDWARKALDARVADAWKANFLEASERSDSAMFGSHPEEAD